ncbi:hypothetical protein ACC808_03215 [Rhizobium ruizarguesonis]|uniref:hypothetical protein n=1 Tax=Rhizobium ruizarguesonis TaxID=2081791 RepID=UPI001FF054AC|nr:hypothetical protein [Rhizobium ruizarguesonis]
MITRRSALIVFASAVFSGGVYAQDQVTDGRSPGSLAFKITQLPVKSDTDDLALMASYGDGDYQTKFAIELQSESRGRFLHVAGGARPTHFISELGKALEASDPRLSNAKQDTLAFDIAFLGPPTVRSSGGGFGGGPGDWYTTRFSSEKIKPRSTLTSISCPVRRSSASRTRAMATLSSPNCPR